MRKFFVVFISFCIILSSFSLLGLSKKQENYEIFLPIPLSVNMTYRDAIYSRCSVRTFKSSIPISDEELSTVLWAAYGFRDDGNRTVASIEGLFSTIIYVFREEAAYTYNPLNHSLLFYQEGDLRTIVNWQHLAPIQLGIVWDKNINGDGNYSSVEIGEIAQNIYFSANALGLGTVTAGLTGFDEINLPENQIGRIVMPLGFPFKKPVFEYWPNLISFLPKIQNSSENLIDVINKRVKDPSYDGDLDRQEVSQILWSSYGFSYLIDVTNSMSNEVERHRTVPSSSCSYPLVIYAITSKAIFRYFPHILHLNPYSDNPYFSTDWEFPVVSFILPIRFGDFRDEISQASSNEDIESAPLILIPVLPRSSLYDNKYKWAWYYEAGASAYNVMLESTILDLHSDIIIPNDLAAIKSILRINDDSLPLIIVPVGR
jgi:nitroreductase